MKEKAPIKDGYRRCDRCREFNIPIARNPKAKYCSKCLPIIKVDNLRRGRVIQRDKKRVSKERPQPDYQSTVTLRAPDGSMVKLRDDEEKEYYENRRSKYMADFEWNESADASLLSRMLFQELLCKRQEDLLAIDPSHDNIQQMVRLTELVRKLQQDLGIDRLKRISQSEKASAKQIIKDMLIKFKKYRARNKDRFVYRCEKCGFLNYMYRERENEESGKV